MSNEHELSNKLICVYCGIGGMLITGPGYLKCHRISPPKPKDQIKEAIHNKKEE